MSLFGTPVAAGSGAGLVIHSARAVAPPVQPARVSPAETIAIVRESAHCVADILLTRALFLRGLASHTLSTCASIANDPQLTEHVGDYAELSPAQAWTAAVDAFLAERHSRSPLDPATVAHVLDVRDRVVAHLLHHVEPGQAKTDEPSVLFDATISGCTLACLDSERVVAIAVADTQLSKSVLALARERGIPFVMGVRDLPCAGVTGRALVDGSDGRIELDPTTATVTGLANTIAHQRDLASQWSGQARTKDDRRIKVLADVRGPALMPEASRYPVDGFTLGRGCGTSTDTSTGTAEDPPVARQAAAYERAIDLAGGRPVLVHLPEARSVGQTTDAATGGLRGWRQTRQRPGTIDLALRAIAMAADDTTSRVYVVAPMVTLPSEAEEFAARVRSFGLRPSLTVETAAAAIQGTRLFSHVDYVSVDVDRLTQHLFATGTASDDLLDLTDPWQHASLSVVRSIISTSIASGVPVGISGDAVNDLQLACVYVGMGATSLIAPTSTVRRLGARLADVSFLQCQQASTAALSADFPTDARARATSILSAVTLA